MKKLKCLIVALVFAEVGLLAAHSQGYSLNWYKISGGGGVSTNAQYTLSGTIGQHDAGGPSTGGGYSLSSGFWALFAVQTPSEPPLFITLSGGNAVVSWPAPATGFLLESNNNLSQTQGWTSVPTAPVMVNGYCYVTNAIAPGSTFYRLRHP